MLITSWSLADLDENEPPDSVDVGEFIRAVLLRYVPSCGEKLNPEKPDNQERARIYTDRPHQWTDECSRLVQIWIGINILASFDSIMIIEARNIFYEV